MKLPVFTFQFLIGEGVMHLAVRRNLQRLPKRFPIGTTYVVEGHVVEGQGHEGGRHLQVFSRYVVLPSGQRLEVVKDNRNQEVVGLLLPKNRGRRALGEQRAKKPGDRRS